MGRSFIGSCIASIYKYIFTNGYKMARDWIALAGGLLDPYHPLWKDMEEALRPIAAASLPLLLLGISFYLVLAFQLIKSYYHSKLKGREQQLLELLSQKSAQLSQLQQSSDEAAEAQKGQSSRLQQLEAMLQVCGPCLNVVAPYQAGSAPLRNPQCLQIDRKHSQWLQADMTIAYLLGTGHACSPNVFVFARTYCC